MSYSRKALDFIRRPGNHKPRGLQWRSSVWFVTLIVGYGIAIDLTVYSVIIPVIPFQLERLGYKSVSARTAWLLFTYSLGLVLSTFPISWYSERYNSRKAPLLCGLVALILFLIMLMEAPNFGTMVVARFFEGVSGAAIWITGLALICDTVPEKNIGRQLGFAMSGLTVGLVVGPPIGGALFDRFGYRAPFVFCILVAVLDMAGRLLVIERKDAMKHGFDPADPSLAPENQLIKDRYRSSIPYYKVLLLMLKSSRTLATAFGSVIYAVTITMLEPTLPLRLNDLWNFNSSKVGLVYLGMAIPTILTTFLLGWAVDHYGTEWITVVCFASTIPWYLFLMIKRSLAFFVISLVVQNAFLSGVSAPLSAELASIKRSKEDIGYAHIYGAFNIAYGIGSTVGPIMAGQIYDHTRNGWIAVCCIGALLLFIACILAMAFVGERPLLSRIRNRRREVGREDVSIPLGQLDSRKWKKLEK